MSLEDTMSEAGREIMYKTGPVPKGDRRCRELERMPFVGAPMGQARDPLRSAQLPQEIPSVDHARVFRARRGAH